MNFILYIVAIEEINVEEISSVQRPLIEDLKSDIKSVLRT